MKTKNIMLVFALMISLFSNVIGQQFLQLHFTAKQLNQQITMDSILIQNLTQGGDTILYWPNTVLTLGNTGIEEDFLSPRPQDLIQIFPNPVSNQSVIRINQERSGQLKLEVYDQLGRRQAELSRNLGPGMHDFLLIPGKERIYFVTAQLNDRAESIKIISLNNDILDKASVIYQGTERSVLKLSNLAASGNFTMMHGDFMRCIGYKDSVMAVMRDSVINGRTYLISFGTSPPCGGQPVVIYEGKEYLTVKIGNQCWMAENLDVGIMTADHYTGSSHSHASNNSVTEKYCYKNEMNNCHIYGGLYDWNEMMGYVTASGTQGICPNYWHIPNDGDWTVLVNFLGGAINAKGMVQETGSAHWYNFNSGATNSSGFTAIPGGQRWKEGSFENLHVGAEFYTSTSVGGLAGSRDLYDTGTTHYRDKTFGYSVRCVRD